MNDMKRDIEGFDAAMQEETKKLQKKQEELAQYAPSSPQFKKADEELAHMKSDFQIRVQAKKREFLEQEAKVYYNIYREVEDNVAEFAQRNGIRLVLRFTGDEMKPDDRATVLQGVNKPVVYQSQLDITLAVLNKLNAGATMPAGGGVAPAPGSPGVGQPPQISTRPGPTLPTAPPRTTTR
jgi:Skp family chaperone for outer membrane proteins